MHIGIDLGGSKIAGVALDQGSVVAQQRIATPQGDYAATLASIRQLVAALEAQTGQPASRIGVGHPGSISPVTGRLRNANSTCLNGQSLAQDLQQGDTRPWHFANDADCLALSESFDGAAKDASSAFCVILGTGVGGALTVKGQLLQGRNAVCGEWGHNPLPWLQEDEWPGTRCWCGQANCIESWLSGPALSADHANAGGDSLPVQAIVALAGQGDATAQASLQRYAQRLARALAAVINLFDPQTIVLAGGLSQMNFLYDEVPRLWKHWVFSDSVSTPLVAAQHGDASGVLGAARLGQG